MRFPSWVAVSRLALLAALLLGWSVPGAPVAAAAPPKLTVLEATLDAAISPAQVDLLNDAVQKAQQLSAALLLVRLDTPGGGIEPMRHMVTTILNSPVPIAFWVAPSGARAASAGVFLMAAAQVNAMAPDTTIGSASPVGPGGGNLNSTLDTKIRNDLESLVRGLATSRGRNADWYTRSVSAAQNLTAAEAVRNRVVDYIAIDRNDLLTQIGKRGLVTGGTSLHFQADEVTVVPFETGWRYALLSWLLDPQIAYILLLVGVAGIFFELTTPGAVLPGIIGGLCLLPALYALSLLPTNAAGLLLLLFGGVLFLLEIHVNSYGLLSLGGIAALFTGSVLLFRPGSQAALPLTVIAPTVAGVSLILFGAGLLLAKAQRQKPRSGLEALVGQLAVVRHFEGNAGKVFIHGELWNATLDADRTADQPVPGQSVRITATRGMTLVVTTITKP